MENTLFTIDRKDFKNLFEKQSGIVKFTSKKNYFDKKNLMIILLKKIDCVQFIYGLNFPFLKFQSRS